MYMAEDTGKRLLRIARDGLKVFVEERIPAGFKVIRHVGHGTVYSAIIEMWPKRRVPISSSWHRTARP